MGRQVRLHPLALLHVITVDTYYRKLRNRIFQWRENNSEHRARKATLKIWIATHRANKNAKANMAEFRRIANCMRHDGVLIAQDTVLSPRKARDYSMKGV